MSVSAASSPPAILCEALTKPGSARRSIEGEMSCHQGCCGTCHLWREAFTLPGLAGLEAVRRCSSSLLTHPRHHSAGR